MSVNMHISRWEGTTGQPVLCKVPNCKLQTCKRWDPKVRTFKKQLTTVDRRPYLLQTCVRAAHCLPAVYNSSRDEKLKFWASRLSTHRKSPERCKSEKTFPDRKLLQRENLGVRTGLAPVVGERSCATCCGELVGGCLCVWPPWLQFPPVRLLGQVAVMS